jgi:uncharacterized surface protein with fasciclin (FAS1) repeats
MAFRPHRQTVKRAFLLLGVIATGTAIALPVTAGNNHSLRSYVQATSAQATSAQATSTLTKPTAATTDAASSATTPAASSARTIADITANADADRMPPVIRVSPPSVLTSPAARTTPASGIPASDASAPNAPAHTLPAHTNPSGNPSSVNLVPTSPVLLTPASTPDQAAPNPASPTSPATATPTNLEPSANPAAAPTTNQSSNQSGNQPGSPTTNTVVDVAASNEKFKTLVAALNEAELTQVLKGNGPFTIFAPTDEAFNALPAGTLEELLKPENRATLLKVLTYHVVPAKVTAGQLRAGEVRTVEGSPITVAIKNDKVTVNGANVTQTDIMASNGVIHVIDKVILPGM